MVKDSTQQVSLNKKNEVENSKKKALKSKSNKKQFLKQKLIDYILILPYLPKEKEIYYIIGDISIDFDLIRNQKDPVIISSLSAWRKVVLIEKQSHRIHLTLEKPKQQAISNFDFITKKLLSLGDQRYQQFAIAMENYREKQNEYEKIKNGVNKTHPIDFSVQYWLSKIKAFNVLYNLQRSTIKYYAYHICAGSYEGQILMEKGYSEELIKLLGMDFETFKSITLRRGMIDFLNPQTQLNIMLRRMLSDEDKRQTYSNQRQYTTTIITADSYTIDVITKPQLIVLNDTSAHEQGHLNDTMGFIEIEIEESVIRELQEKRKISNQLMLDNDYDFEYNMQAEVFINSIISETKTIQSTKNEQDNLSDELKAPLVAKYRSINQLQDTDISTRENRNIFTEQSADVHYNEISLNNSIYESEQVISLIHSQLQLITYHSKNMIDFDNQKNLTKEALKKDDRK